MMHPDKFGDSYDIVKRSILGWLRPCGTWAVHPMFAEDFDQSFAAKYSAFLGVPLVKPKPPYPVRKKGAKRAAYLEERGVYFKDVGQWVKRDHLFLDPDTGLRLPPCGTTRQWPGKYLMTDESRPNKFVPEKYLTADELRDIAQKRPDKLVLVFDQSIEYGTDDMRRRETEKKLACLQNYGLSGRTYFSHANFVLVSACKKVLNDAHRILLRKSKLPEERIVEVQGMLE